MQPLQIATFEHPRESGKNAQVQLRAPRGLDAGYSIFTA